MTVEPDGMSLFWGDFHKHLTGHRRGRISSNLERADEIIGHARHNVDVYAPLCYPFESHRVGRTDGIGVETVRGRPRFERWWEEIEALSREHLDPGRFVTFPAYEWHGDRTRWGDHNVVYFEEGYPLDDEWALADLYRNLSDRRGFAIPHHTAYLHGHRAKDWDVHDPECSPVMEVYSGQGSSEGIGTPLGMNTNPSMGPRTSGGTLVDGLDRGHRIGVIASNDWTGLPGSWNSGVAGLWATDLTREAIWEAIENRRTYGVTGDRIELWWAIDGNPMGSVADGGDERRAEVSVDCPQPLDRIELIHDGTVVRSYDHRTDGRIDDDDRVRKVLVEFGWGPTTESGDFDDVECEWRGTALVDGGAVVDVSPRFSGFGQRYDLEGSGCRFHLVTSRDHTRDFLPSRAPIRHHRQGLIFEIEADDGSELVIDLEGRDAIAVPIEDARTRAHVFPLLDESRARIEDEFGIAEEHLDEGPFAHDVYYGNARAIKVHPAHPASACAAGITVEDLPTSSGDDYYYVRASQVDGQYAWSSPIWM